MFALVISCSCLFMVVLMSCSILGKLISDGSYFNEITFGSLFVFISYFVVYLYFFKKKLDKEKEKRIQQISDDIINMNHRKIPLYLADKVNSGAITHKDVEFLVRGLDIIDRAADNLVDKTSALYLKNDPDHNLSY